MLSAACHVTVTPKNRALPQERGVDVSQVRREMDTGDQYLEPALRVSRLETRSLAAEASSLEVGQQPMLQFSEWREAPELAHQQRLV